MKYKNINNRYLLLNVVQDVYIFFSAFFFFLKGLRVQSPSPALILRVAAWLQTRGLTMLSQFPRKEEINNPYPWIFKNNVAL